MKLTPRSTSDLLPKPLLTVGLGLFMMSIAGCQPAAESAPTQPAQAVASAQQAFMQQFSAYCGQAFVGQVMVDDSNDPVWQVPIVMHIRDCAPNEVKIPLHVGDDRSRTWVISTTATGLQLQHIHLHQDGSPDAVSPYGGHTIDAGTATTQQFPVDEASKDLFAEHSLLASQQNTWHAGFPTPTSFSYKLTRPGREFEVHFDLTQPVPVPPPAWGYTP